MTNGHQEGGERRFLRGVIRRLERAPSFFGRRSHRHAKRLTALCEALLSERGEVSGVRLATEALSAYRSLNTEARDAFLDSLAANFLPSPAKVAQAADNYRRSPSPSTLSRLQVVVESPRQELFRRLNLARGGIGALIEIRRHLLKAMGNHPTWDGIDADLAHLFRSWFNGGFLLLQRIDWATSAAVLERLIKHEAVHEIQGWTDLRRRLETDRRCYAFFHPALPNEPLVFIEIALTRGMTSDVQSLLNPSSDVCRSADADTAVFYSITNCQEGLRGVSFGNLLIKSVVDDLKRELPRLRVFATLSPIPGFRDWLVMTLRSLPTGPTRDQLLAVAEAGGQSASPSTMTTLMREELTRLCAFYLIHAKRERLPLDTVARFHLANGASLRRLNWMSDTSERGMRQSMGFMVNYVYGIADLERNHEQYAKACRVVASRKLHWLAKKSLAVAHPRAPSEAHATASA